MFIDRYEWLRDKSNPEVIDYLNAENAYTDAMTAGIKPLADKLYGEIKGRMQEVGDLALHLRGRHEGVQGRSLLPQHHHNAVLAMLMAALRHPHRPPCQRPDEEREAKDEGAGQKHVTGNLTRARGGGNTGHTHLTTPLSRKNIG